MNCTVEIPDGSLGSYIDRWCVLKVFGSEVSEENTYTVTSAGNLMNQLPLDRVEEIKSMKLIGEINGTDLLMLNRCPNIVSLDLSEATIVSGGMPYYEKDNERFGTEDNTLGQMWSYNLNNLTWLKLPKTLVKIGERALYNKTKLVELSIPNTVTSVGSYAFSGCNGLTKAEFASIESLCKIEFSELTSNPLYYSNNLWIAGEEIKDLIIPEIVTSIGSYAFSGCRGLTSVFIPNSVTTIEHSAFNYCSALKEIVIEDGEDVLSLGYNQKGTNDDNAKGLFFDCPLESVYIGRNLSYRTEYSYGYSPFNTKKTLTSVTIGGSCTTIGEYAFGYCRGLTSVTIGNSVTSIGSSAFSGCSGLTTVTIGNSVTSIGSSAFSYCSGLTSVTIGNSVTRIGESAFYGCSGLTSVTIGNSVTSIGESAFYECSGLTTVTIGNSVTSIGSSAFSGCSGLTTVTIPNSVTSIDNYAFYGCSGLRDLIIEDGDEELSLGYNEESNYTNIAGESLFYDCSLESIYIGRDLSYKRDSRYGYSPFYSNKTLKSVTIGKTVTSIGDYAFRGCSGLTTVTIPNSVTSIGDYAFRGCSGLTSINIPDPVQRIGADAFRSCSALDEIVLPGSLREVGSGAFADCSKLTKIKVINPIPPVIESKTFSAVDASAALSVPDGSRVIYWIHPYWGKFTTINTWGGSESAETTFETESVKYRVTSEADRTVEITAAALTGRSPELVIPEEVEFNGTSYRVAGVANSGFENVKVASVSLPATIGYVGLEAFKGCDNLRSIECNAVTPPSVYSNTFDQSAYTSVKLGVPEDSMDAYKAHSIWGQFKLDPMSGIDTSIEMDADLNVDSEGSVYNLSGLLIGSGDIREILQDLMPGIYIVRQGNVVKKIAVK